MYGSVARSHAVAAELGRWPGVSLRNQRKTSCPVAVTGLNV
jgi:uncharacterized protein YeaC (DUF1315 family)